MFLEMTSCDQNIYQVCSILGILWQLNFQCMWKGRSICKWDSVSRYDEYFDVKYFWSFDWPTSQKAVNFCIIFVFESCIVITGTGIKNFDELFIVIRNLTLISVQFCPEFSLYISTTIWNKVKLFDLIIL